MNIEDIEAKGRQLSTRAYLATVGTDGEPDVVPVHPGWEGTIIWIMTGRSSVKARNIAHNTSVAMHWEVNEAGDGLPVWGRAAIHTEIETKQRLWTGVFDYDLDLFAPGGFESPETVLISVEPRSAVYAPTYGTGAIDRWSMA